MNQGGQGDDTAFPVVVCPKHEYQVFQADDKNERPKHERENSHHVGVVHSNAVFSVETLPNRVYRTRGDVSENHAQGGQRQLGQTAVDLGVAALFLWFFQARFLSSFCANRDGLAPALLRWQSYVGQDAINPWFILSF